MAKLKLPTLEEMGEETAKWALDNVLYDGKTIREWVAIICDLDSCEDCISREAAVHACTNGWNKDYKEIMADIRALPPVYPVRTECEDAISRQEAIDAFNAFADESNQDTDIHEAIEIVLNLPFVTTAEKVGRWIKIVTEKDEHHETWHYECSECRWQGSMFGNDPYCGNCGAKMASPYKAESEE